MVDTRDCLTVTQVAERLHITRQAVLKAIKTGRIKAEAFDAGKRASFYLIPKKELKKMQ